MSQTKEDGSFWRVPLWFPKLPVELVQKLDQFHTELLFFNNKLNLVSARTSRTSDLTHIADGIMGVQAFLDLAPSGEVYDVGSGNGIPGLVLAILDPNRKIVLVDSDMRKTEFLRHVAHKLGLANCSVVNSRIEDLPDGSITLAITRGFASVTKTLITCRKLVRDSGMVVHFKGPSWPSEVASLPSQVLAHWEPVHAKDYVLPENGGQMSLIVTKRVG